jgi:photosystem II stability/assembly factor-like uncharacterized protein
MRHSFIFIAISLVLTACASSAAPTATPIPAGAATLAPSSAPAPGVGASPASPVPQPAAAAHFASGAPIQLDSIAMHSRTEGWGLSGPYVLTTGDGGETWREATPPESFPSDMQSRAYGAFLDAHTAWIIFARDDHIPSETSVWHTTDGGRTWSAGPTLSHQAVGDRVWADFAVLDAQHLWLLIRGTYVGAGTHFDHQLFRTADGGSTWTSLDAERSNDYTGMIFADTQFGLRTLQTTGAWAAAPPAYDVTADGGATWENRELPPPPGAPDLFNEYPYCETYQPVLLSAASIRMLVGCFDYHYPPQQTTSYVYSSEDGGATWRTVHLPEEVQAAQAQLTYFDPNNALLLGRDIYRTASDGQTWSFVKTVNWDGQFSFSDSQYGWAVARANGEVALVQTTDGAATWTLLKPTVMQ